MVGGSGRESDRAAGPAVSGKSCVFEIAEHDLHASMRTTAVRLCWVDMWQLREKELGVASIRLDAGLK